MKQTYYRNIKFNPLFILIAISVLLLITVFRASSSSFFATASLKDWNFQDLDVARNGNALRALLLLKTENRLSFITPSPIDVVNKPSDYYGQYLQFSGIVKSIQPYSPSNNLESLIIGDSTEIIMVTSDGTTIIDFFLIGRNTYLTPGASLTVYGYSPGLRYQRNTQGWVNPELVLIGSLEK